MFAREGARRRVDVDRWPRRQGPAGDTEAALRRSAVALRPGWVLLAGAALRRDAPWAEDVEAALVHADVGVALLGVRPAFGVAGKLREALATTGFAGTFGGLPPVVFLLVPPPGAALQEVLDQAFETEPALSLADRAGWARAVQDSLTASAADRAALAAAPARGASSRVGEGAATPAPVSPPLARGGGRKRRRRRFAPVPVAALGLAMLGGLAAILPEAGSLLPAVVMGVVEGLTEFLPISSTGHLILLGEVIGFSGPPGKVFEISIQFGAVLAVVWLMRDVLWRIATRGWVPGTPAHRYARTILLAFLPAMALGATLHAPITARLFSPSVVAVALIVGGAALIACERWRPAPRIRSVLEIGSMPALLIGFGQALALVPGTSRAGATIIVALLVGVERRTAVEFSFMLAIPTMLAATAYSLWQSRAALDTAAIGQIAVGFAVSFVVALAVVRWMLAAIGRIGFAPFGWYRIALGAAILAWSMPR
jgi:undecaprenyl-diphosphatase